MKRLLAFIALCLPIYLFAQGFGSFSHDQPYLAKDVVSGGGGGGQCNPLGIPDPATNTIYRWWVSTDNNPSLGRINTNLWRDRMFCDVSSVSDVNQAANFTNSPNNNGWVSWNFASGTGGITNVALAAGTNATYAIIFSPTNDTISTPAPLWTPASPSDAVQNGYPRGFMRESNESLRWGTAFKGGQVIIPTLATNGVWYDLIMVQSNTVARFYTNGVFSVAINTTPPAGGWPFYEWGADRTGSGETFRGYIRELVVWSNTVFNATSISNYHRYATNTYTYTP